MSDFYDPTDPRSLARARERHDEDVQRKRMERANDIKRLMSSDWGRRLAWSMLEDAKTYQPTFNTNAMTMARDEGRRSFGLDLLAYVQMTCPEMFIVMLQEGMKRQKRKDEIE